MTTLMVERLGDSLVIRLNHEAEEALGLHAGDAVSLSRTPSGELALAAPDIDHQLRHERGRAFLRRYRNPY